MINIKHTKFLFVILTIGFLYGCASTLSGEHYSREEARTPQAVEFGTVVYTRKVIIEGTKTPIGAGAGTIAGGIAGSTIGDGKGSQIASVLGSVVGGLAGAAAEESLTKSQGIEITVELKSGKTFAIVQKHNPDISFKPGDKVRILKSRGTTRIAH